MFRKIKDLFLVQFEEKIIVYRIKSKLINKITKRFFMETKHKISLWAAILINLNTILGSGIFINPAPLTKIAGSFGYLGYLASMFILLPIVLSIAELAKLHPTSGGLYVYSKEYISPMIGFVSGWGYFLGKATAVALLCNIVMIFLQSNITILQNIPLLFLDFMLISFLATINIIGAKIAGNIQYVFAVSKFIPIATVIFAGIFFFSIPTSNVINPFQTIPSSLPIAIFALMSFEIICSIGHLIENSDKNIKKTILFSFTFAALVTILFQVMIFATVGTNLANSIDPLRDFGMIAFSRFPFIAKLISAVVMGSILGGAFSSLTMNSWNIYTLAKNKHVPFKNLFTKINKHQVPWISLLFEVLIACILLAISKKQIPLQSMAVFCIVSSYMLSSVAALLSKAKKGFNEKLIPILAIISSNYIMWLCLKKLYNYGISLPYLTIFLSGIIIALFRYKKSRTNLQLNS